MARCSSGSIRESSQDKLVNRSRAHPSRPETRTVITCSTLAKCMSSSWVAENLEKTGTGGRPWVCRSLSNALDLPRIAAFSAVLPVQVLRDVAILKLRAACCFRISAFCLQRENSRRRMAARDFAVRRAAFSAAMRRSSSQRARRASSAAFLKHTNSLDVG